MSFEKPYDGLRVVDMSHAVAGPYCGMILGRLGADVIKIEPLGGDISRNVGKKYPGMQTDLNIFANLGKRSVCIDLKSEEGAEILRRLLKSADVFIENFRPGVTERLGFGYESVARINPQIIYVSVSGWGQRGPFRERPGTDTDLQAFSGFMANNHGADRVPVRSPLIWIDIATAMYNLQAVQAALWTRREDNRGRHIDNSLLESAAAFLNYNLLNHIMEPRGDRRSVKLYPFGIFKCADGYVQISVGKDVEFKPFMEMLGLRELGNDERMMTAADRFEHRQVIDKPIADAIAPLTTADLCRRLRELRMLHERINGYDDFMQHEQTKAVDALYWHDLPGIGTLPYANIPGTPKLDAESAASARAPDLGAHTHEILEELGYSTAQIRTLEQAGTINAQR